MLKPLKTKDGSQFFVAFVCSPFIGAILGSLLVAVAAYLDDPLDISIVVMFITIVMVFAYFGILFALPVHIVLNGLGLCQWYLYVFIGGGLAYVMIHDAIVWKWSVVVGMVTAYIFWFIGVRNNVVIANVDGAE